MMLKQSNTLNYETILQSSLMVSPETVIDQMGRDPANLKTILSNLLKAASSIEPSLHFDTSIESFMGDLAHQKLRNVLLSVVESKQADPELREIVVKLLLAVGLTRASGEDILRAAILQSNFKINITNEIEFLCKQSEVFKDPFAESGESEQ